jgi:hypothetical protein
MTCHMGNAGRRVSLRSTMTRQPRTDPRPEPFSATSAARAGWDRLVAAFHLYPLLTDVALAAVVLVLSVPPFTPVVGPDRGLWLALVIAMAVALMWRRRAPFAVFAFMGLVILVQLNYSVPASGDPVLVAFYTVAAYARARLVAIAAALWWVELLWIAIGSGSWQSAVRTFGCGPPLPRWPGSWAITPVPGGPTSRPWRTGPGGWSVSGTSRRSSPRPPNGSGSRARCTTSSRTISR